MGLTHGPMIACLSMIMNMLQSRCNQHSDYYEHSAFNHKHVAHQILRITCWCKWTKQQRLFASTFHRTVHIWGSHTTNRLCVGNVEHSQDGCSIHLLEYIKQCNSKNLYQKKQNFCGVSSFAGLVTVGFCHPVDVFSCVNDNISRVTQVSKYFRNNAAGG